jgi:hypothetical protein
LQWICSNRQLGEISPPLQLVQIGILLRKSSWAPSAPGFTDSEALIEMRLAAYTAERAIGTPVDRHMVIEVRANRCPAADWSPFPTLPSSRPPALERSNATLKNARDRTENYLPEFELALAKSTAEDANISKTHSAAASHDILQPLRGPALCDESGRAPERRRDLRLVETSTICWRQSRRPRALLDISCSTPAPGRRRSRVSRWPT